MLEITDIQDIINAIVKLEKQSKGEMTMYSKVYHKATHDSMKLRVHALGEYPEMLFKRKVPNETEEQRDYRLMSFEPTTMPVWERAEGAIKGRVFNRSNFTIKFTEEDQGNYFMGEYPQYMTIIEYYRTVRLPAKLYDAMAVMCIKPLSLPVTVNNDGEMVFDDTQQIEPVAVIYDSKQAIEVNDSYVLIKLYEKSMVKHGNSTVKEGNIFELYDDMNIWRITQVGRKVDNTYEITVYYNHALGYIPCQRLKGKPMTFDEKVVYQSYFYPALADLNDALFDESTLRIGKISHMYPERWTVRSRCPEPGCNDGKIMGQDGEWNTCSTCGGSGMKPHTTNTIEVILPDRISPDIPDPVLPPAGYITKESDTIQFLRTEIENKIESAFLNLNIDVTNRANGQTATEVKLDRDEFHSFLLHLSNEEFSSLEWSVKTIGLMRYNTEIDFQLIPPQNFNVRSDDELSDELKNAKENKLPAVTQISILTEFINKRFADNSEQSKILETIIKVDRLFLLNEQDITSQILNGTTSKMESILHTSINTFIADAIDADNDFLTKDIEAQRGVLVQMAEDKLNAIPSNVGSNVIAQNITPVI